MQLRQIMTSKVEVVRPDAPLIDAAKRMKELDVGAVPVCDGDRLCGMITDRDIAIRAVAEGKSPKRVKVRDVMTPEVLYCFEDQESETAASVMQDHQIRRLPIVDREKRLVGIVSLGDLSVKGQNEKLTAETVERISEASHSRH